ncbi:hypothetical protein CFIMG_007425RA00001 [Ceratocystis fimbriata CBS 114723]|uniref:Uncharacterized protein n=1 Tax=Ceratocystis fimbriata CBS 114723 TaxID=1035309 RepID=A0A2C5WD33_9PEZI|nr:hypothetical protein CFIMG_007425RA00001 [Ceratocystis fimbriata CBS 114723]
MAMALSLYLPTGFSPGGRPAISHDTGSQQFDHKPLSLLRIDSTRDSTCVSSRAIMLGRA